MGLPSLTIGDLTATYPIIQGGMGVGISLSGLAGAVAKAGGIGIISTAQIGFKEEIFELSPPKANMIAIEKEFKRAKKISNNGIIGFNIMSATNHYDRYVKRCVEVGADLIISGAGLPIKLPELVQGSKTKFAPIISSAKGAKVLLFTWQKRYNTTADFIIIEGPKAGGHLGFKAKDIQKSIDLMDEEITQILTVVEKFEDFFQKKIPVIFAGGVFDRSDINHYLSLGCSGVQIATRFVGTEECDAPLSFKQAYINAKPGDINLVSSPVGMPGRGISNAFTERIKQERIPIEKCRDCLSKKHCDKKTIPYCISETLINAARGEADNALVFAGSNAYRINSITTVPELFKEWTTD